MFYTTDLGGFRSRLKSQVLSAKSGGGPDLVKTRLDTCMGSHLSGDGTTGFETT